MTERKRAEVATTHSLTGFSKAVAFELNQEGSPQSIDFLSEAIDNENTIRSTILKSTKPYLQPIIKRFEALDNEMPCIRKFQKPPQSQPLTLCMECAPEKDFSHWDILEAIEQIVPNAFERQQMSRIQFENMNVICGTAGQKNRWLITLSDFQTCNLLRRTGLVISGDHFPLRRHDDINAEDYKMRLKRCLSRKNILDMLSETNNGSNIKGK